MKVLLGDGDVKFLQNDIPKQENCAHLQWNLWEIFAMVDTIIAKIHAQKLFPLHKRKYSLCTSYESQTPLLAFQLTPNV